MFLDGLQVHLAGCGHEEMLELTRICRDGAATRHTELYSAVTHIVVSLVPLLLTQRLCTRTHLGIKDVLEEGPQSSDRGEARYRREGEHSEHIFPLSCRWALTPRVRSWMACARTYRCLAAQQDTVACLAGPCTRGLVMLLALSVVLCEAQPTSKSRTVRPRSLLHAYTCTHKCAEVLGLGQPGVCGVLQTHAGGVRAAKAEWLRRCGAARDLVPLDVRWELTADKLLAGAREQAGTGLSAGSRQQCSGAADAIEQGMAVASHFVLHGLSASGRHKKRFAPKAGGYFAGRTHGSEQCI